MRRNKIMGNNMTQSKIKKQYPTAFKNVSFVFDIFSFFCSNHLQIKPVASLSLTTGFGKNSPAGLSVPCNMPNSIIKSNYNVFLTKMIILGTAYLIRRIRYDVPEMDPS